MKWTNRLKPAETYTYTHTHTHTGKSLNGQKQIGTICFSKIFRIFIAPIFAIFCGLFCNIESAHAGDCATNGNINSGYTRLSYLQSSGTQYIDTGTSIQFGDEFYFDYMKMSYVSTEDKGYGVMSVEIAGGGRRKNGYVTMWVGNNYSYSIPQNDALQKRYVENWVISSGKLTSTLTEVGTSNVYNLTASNSGLSSSLSTSDMFLFKGAGGEVSPSAMRLYLTWLKRSNGDYAFYLIPAKRDSDGVIGMCDTVTGNFLTNAGTGTFTAGPTISSDLTVTYSCGSGSGTAPTDSKNYTTSDRVATLSNTCTPPSGKVFDKWLCGSDVLSEGSVFYILSNTTCIAQYSSLYAVTYSCGTGGGIAPTDSNTYTNSNNTVTALSNTCTPPSGKGFEEWLCGSTNVNPGSSFTISSNTTCTAQYFTLCGFNGNINTGSGYTQLEYLQSSGTQYINTGTSVQFGDEFYFDYMKTSYLSGENKGYGVSSSNISGGGRISGGYVTMYVFYNNYGYGLSSSDALQKRYVENWVISSGKLTSTLTEVGTSNVYNLTASNGSFKSSFSTSILYLFRDYYPYNTGISSMRIYLTWLKRSNGNYAFYLVPAQRGTDNVLGMCDTVSGFFYTNAGTGTFTAGPAVSANNFTVTYACGSGSGTAPRDSNTYATGATVTTLSNTCTAPSGYGFAKWNCGGTDVNAGSTFTMSLNTVCTAQYASIVSLNWYDGNTQMSGGPSSCVIGSTFVPPTPAARTGYVFTGWKVKTVNP